jgi:hypothetical protein
MGNVEYLAEKILDGSDWKVIGQSNLKQFVTEPLYKLTVRSDSNLKAVNMLDKNDEIALAEKEIYVFYSQLEEKAESL